MATEASGLWSTFVHSAEGPSEVSGLWSTFVHSATGPSEVSGLWTTFVHSATGPSEVSGLWSTFVHSAEGPSEVSGLWTTFTHTVPSISAVISNTPGAGTVGTPFTFIGSNSIALFYSWTITSKPVGSAVGDPIPLPDGGATTPFDMTNNAVLYHLNGNANDTSGNTQNGTEVGSPTYAAGQIGQAISLDGTTGQYISVANSPTVTITGNMSIAAWVNMDLTGDGFQRIVGKATGGSGFGGYALYVNTNGQPRVAFGGTQTTTAATGLITASTWHHIVGTWDGSTARVYVDGVLVDSLTAGSGPGSSTADLHIGADPSFPGTRDFKGLLDEVAIWSRTLSESEIADLYLLQTTGFALDEADLTFTPDLVGTYDVQLEVSGSGPTGYETDTTTGTVVVSVAPPPGGGTLNPLQGDAIRFWEKLQGSPLRKRGS